MNPEQLRRGRATHTPKDRVLIVGSTALHQAYARWLLRRIDQHPGLFEEVSADPEQLLREAARIARKQRAMGSECQQVWAILDGITPDQALHLRQAAKTPGVSVVSSSPDFRTWLLLHRADYPALVIADTLAPSLSTTVDHPFADYEAALAGCYELARERAMALDPQEGVHTDAYRLVDGILLSSERFHGHRHDAI